MRNLVAGFENLKTSDLNYGIEMLGNNVFKDSKNFTSIFIQEPL